jgi:hypothetical protein
MKITQQLYDTLTEIGFVFPDKGGVDRDSAYLRAKFPFGSLGELWVSVPNNEQASLREIFCAAINRTHENGKIAGRKEITTLITDTLKIT